MIKNSLKFLYLIMLVVIITLTVSLVKVSKEIPEYKLEDVGGNPNSPYSLQVYTSIEKYSKRYKVPKYIAYNIAYLETTYQGPFDWTYHGKLTSYAGAKGPMQIMPKTANYVTGKRISKSDLLHNIDLNVHISMRLLRNLHKRYGDWGVACGYYNTGYPRINDYARFCVSNKEYTKHWIKL